MKSKHNKLEKHDKRNNEKRSRRKSLVYEDPSKERSHESDSSGSNSSSNSEQETLICLMARVMDSSKESSCS